MILLINLEATDNSIIKDRLLLLQDLLGCSNLRLGSLDLNFDQRIGSLPAIGNVDLGSGLLAESLHSRPALTNQRGQLLLLNRYGCSEGVVLQVLVESQDLVTSFVSTLLGASDDNLVRSLLTARLPSNARSISSGLVIFGILLRAREEDEDLVTGLQSVDLGALSPDEFPMEFWLNLQDVSSLVGQLFAECENMCLSGLGLSLRALEVNFAIMNLNINIELITKLTNVAPALADQVVREFLGEVEA